MVVEELEVLLGLVDLVEFPLDVDEAVILGLADCDLVPRAEAECVGVDEPVLEETDVLVVDPDPVDVLELVIEAVTVFVVLIVPVNLGDRDAEEEAVDVLEGRIEAVCELEPVCVLDWGADLV